MDKRHELAAILTEIEQISNMDEMLDNASDENVKDLYLQILVLQARFDRLAQKAKARKDRIERKGKN